MRRTLVDLSIEGTKRRRQRATRDPQFPFRAEQVIFHPKLPSARIHLITFAARSLVHSHEGVKLGDLEQGGRMADCISGAEIDAGLRIEVEASVRMGEKLTVIFVGEEIPEDARES